MGYKCNIFLISPLTFHFSCTDNIMLLLLGTIEPTEKETGSLSLLSTISAAQIEKDIRILTKKFLDYANYCLRYLNITRGLRMTGICQVKPISCVEGIIILIKRNHIFYTMISSEKEVPMKFCHRVRCQKIDIAEIKCFHGLHPSQIEKPSFFSFLLPTSPLRDPFLGLLLASSLNLTPTFQQCKKLLVYVCDMSSSFCFRHKLNHI